MQRENAPVLSVEAHEFALRRARKYLSLLLKVPADRIEQILSLPEGLELVIGALATVRRIQSEIKERRMVQNLGNAAQIELLKSAISGNGDISTGAEKELLEGSKDEGSPLIERKRGRRSQYLFLEKDALPGIKDEFFGFFQLKENQELYKENGRMPWQLRFDKVITAWNRKNPKKAIYPYQGKQSYRELYAIHGGDDFALVFGFHPTKYTASEGTVGVSQRKGAQEVPPGAKVAVPDTHPFSGDVLNPPSASLGFLDSVTEDPEEKRRRAQELYEQGLNSFMVQIGNYIRKKTFYGDIIQAIDGSFQGFQSLGGNNMRILINFSGKNEDVGRILYAIFSSFEFLGHMSANGWEKNQKTSIWEHRATKAQFIITVPFIPQKVEKKDGENTELEAITTQIATMKGIVVGFINAYTDSLQDKRIEKGHDVARSHNIPRYPEGFIMSRFSGKTITCDTGNRPLPSNLLQALKQKSILLGFYNRVSSQYPGLSIVFEGNAPVFQLENMGYTLRLTTD